MAADKFAWNVDAPLVIAHRGASSVAPENTLPAFEKAIELGADAVEMDLKLSRDGALIVHHDQTLERTTDGSGKVADWDWYELRKLDAGSHLGREYKGVGIPLLEEVFGTLGDTLLYNLELTEYGRPFTDLARKTVEIVEGFGLQSRVLYSSFSPIELFRTSMIVGRSKIALLMHSQTPRILRLLALALIPHSTYHPHDPLVNRGLIKSIKSLEKSMNVWTVNDADRMKQLLRWDVDGIITDLPDRAVHVRDWMGS